MKRSKNLSRQPSLYWGLTKQEFYIQMRVVYITFLPVFLLIGFAIGYKIASFLVGVVILTIANMFLFPRYTVKLKGDMPTDAFIKSIIVKSSKLGLINNPYTSYQGIWSRHKKIGGMGDV